MPANPSTPEVTRADDMSWIDIAVLGRKRGVVILDYAPGWADFIDELHFADVFETDEPDHLAPGVYRWSGFKIGSWDEGDHAVVTGGVFTPQGATPARGEDELREALAKIANYPEGNWHGDNVAMRNIARAALASTDMAGAGEGFRWPEPKFVPVQSGAQLNPARVTAAFELINGELVVGEQFRLVEMLLDGTEYTIAAPPVEGLTSGEGEARAILAKVRSSALWLTDDEAIKAMVEYAASPKATATASVRERVNAVFAENINEQASRLNVHPVATESPGWWQQRVRKAAILATLTDSGTADTHAGSGGVEPFGYWVEQKHADPILLRRPAYIPELSENRKVTPLYAAIPSNQADSVGEAIEAGVVVLEGRGNGTYDEAQDAIRLLIAALHPVDSRAQGGEKA